MKKNKKSLIQVTGALVEEGINKKYISYNSVLIELGYFFANKKRCNIQRNFIYIFTYNIVRKIEFCDR